MSLEPAAAPKAVTLRLATEGDLDTLAALYSRCMAGAPGDEQWALERSRAFLSMWQRRQPDLFFVAEVDGRVVGGHVGDIKPYFDGPRFTDGEMFVDPAVRHLGLAAALMRRCVDEACRRYGIVAKETLANGRSDVVLEWFGRLGFQRTEWIHMEVPVAELRARLGLGPEPSKG